MKNSYSFLVLFLFSIFFIAGCGKDPVKPPPPYDYSNGVMKGDWVEFQLFQNNPFAGDLVIRSLTYANNFKDSTTELTDYKVSSNPLVVHYFKATRDHQPVYLGLNCRGVQITLRIVVNGKPILEASPSYPTLYCKISTPNFVPDSPINNPTGQLIGNSPGR